MVRLREIPRTATFAWSPFPSASPFVATGTRSGAVDASFSNETALEIWDLGLDRKEKGETELAQPVGRCMTDSGFNDIAWAQSEDASHGIIAGALENGALDLWSADKLLNNQSDPLISRVTHHSGPVKTLQFNPKHPNLLATAGSKAELFVSDLNNADSAFRLGNRVARSDDIDCLDWNRRVPHILVTGSSGGFVTVWDVKTKKETLTLSNINRRPVSAIAWDPERPTKLITGTPSQTEPIICLWDLRNSNAPERILKGHENGVLDLAWCAQDPRLLISCGMDDRTLAWNPETGEQYGEYPIVTNWTFQTRFNPHNPNIFATASFDGKIAVQTLQNTCTQQPEHTSTTAGGLEGADGEDFFNNAQSQPQVSTFSLPTAPRWFERPVGATFGFGGKVISIGLVKGSKRASQIKITPFEVDSDITSAAEKFEKALEAGDLRSVCEERIQSAQTEEEKADWKVIETLISKAPKKQLVEYLGLSSDGVDEAADSLGKLGLGPSASSTGAATATAGGNDISEPTTPLTPGTPSHSALKVPKKHKRIASIFEPSPESAHFLSDLSLTKSAKSNDPFHILSGTESDTDRTITRALMCGDFPTALDVALKQDRMSDAFMIAICGGEECVRRAQEYYLTRPRAEGEQGPSYARLLGSIASRNLWDVVHNADLTNWREAVATICTYADTDGDGTGKQFEDLCEVLGDRLVEEFVRSGGEKGEKASYRKDASFCYLISSKLEKVVGLWIEELKEFEDRNIIAATSAATTTTTTAATASSTFSIHAHALQDLIEKVTVFRKVTNFEDPDRNKDASDWKLAQLYEKYVEYANIIASHGCMDVARKYLELLPPSHPEAKVAMDRIKLATRPAGTARAPAAGVGAGRTTPAAAAAGTRTPQRVAQRPATTAAAASNPYAPQTAYAPVSAAAPVAPTPTTTAPTPMAGSAPSNPYAPAGVTAASPAATPRNPYAPTSTSPAAPVNPYAPTSTASRVPANPYAPSGAATYGSPAQRPAAASIPPPPRQFGSVSSAGGAGAGSAPPAQGMSYANASNLPAWNDLPEDLAKKAAVPRRSTPAGIASPYAPAPSVYAPQQQQQGSPMGMGMNMGMGGVRPPPRGPAAVPPPPKGPAPPQRLASPPVNVQGPRVHPAPPVVSMQQSPSPVAVPPPPPANPYAPPPPQASQSPYAVPPPPAQQIQRGPSPYNAPPSVSPSVAGQSRYAPAPAPAAAPAPVQMRTASPYAAGQDGGVAVMSPQGTPIMAHASPSLAAANVSRPPTSQSVKKPASKYPPGDRTHIPASALPIYEILSADMQRVKARAPSSFKAQVNDTERRLNILFDHLNNEELLKEDTIESMVELARAVERREYDRAHEIHLEILTGKMDECGNWMVGVKRLIGMSRATP